MEDRKDHERSIALAEVQGVREPAQYGPAYIREDNRVPFGVTSGQLDRLLDFVEQLVTKPALPTLVPGRRIFQFLSRSRPEYDAQLHRPRRARTRAFTSLQGMTSLG